MWWRLCALTKDLLTCGVWLQATVILFRWRILNVLIEQNSFCFIISLFVKRMLYRVISGTLQMSESLGSGQKD